MSVTKENVAESGLENLNLGIPKLDFPDLTPSPEALARSIRSGLGEIDDFHSALYMLFHHYMPAYDFENIKSSVAELKQKMAGLNSATLPERLKQKEPEFIAARAKLSKSVEALEASIPSNNEKAIKDAVSALHTSFEALNSLFDR